MMNVFQRDPFDPDHSLDHQHSSLCSHTAGNFEHRKLESGDRLIESEGLVSQSLTPQSVSPGEAMCRAIETAVVKTLFGHSDVTRRRVLAAAGAGVVAEMVRGLFDFDAAKGDRVNIVFSGKFLPYKKF